MDTDQRRTVALTALLVLVADLGSKAWVERALADGPVDLGFITLRLAQNPGVAFSLGADQPAWVVTVVTSAAVVLIAWMVLRGHLHPPLAGGLLLGGGLGNLVDRVMGGTVTDFLDLGWFPSFNVADVALNVGVGIVLLVGLVGRDHDHDGEHAATNDETNDTGSSGTADDSNDDGAADDSDNDDAADDSDNDDAADDSDNDDAASDGAAVG